jgi:hypothetical protein
MIFALGWMLFLGMRPVGPFAQATSGRPKQPACVSGSCTFDWSGPAQPISTYNSSFADLSSANTANYLSLSGSGTVGVNTDFRNGGALLQSSTSDTAQIIFSASAGATAGLIKFVCVRADGTNAGYCLEPCYNDGSNNWARICTEKNGVELHQGPISSYDPKADHTAKIVASGTSTVTIEIYFDGVLVDTVTDSSSPLPAGHPGFGTDAGSDLTQNQFGTFQDHP